VRNPASVPARIGLKLVQGTPANLDDVKKAFETRKPDAVIVTLAHAKGAVFDNGALFLTHVTNNIVSAVRTVDTCIRIIYMSAFGVGDSFPGLNFLMRTAVKVTPMATKFGDHEGAENALTSAADIAFVVARPAMLTNGKEETVVTLGERGEKASFMPSISRASVAKFLADAVQNKEWDGKAIVIANGK
jgi:NAD(P)H-binding